MLEQVIIRTGNPKLKYYFSRYVKGANRKALKDALTEFDNDYSFISIEK